MLGLDWMSLSQKLRKCGFDRGYFFACVGARIKGNYFSMSRVLGFFCFLLFLISFILAIDFINYLSDVIMTPTFVLYSSENIATHIFCRQFM